MKFAPELTFEGNVLRVWLVDEYAPGQRSLIYTNAVIPLVEMADHFEVSVSTIRRWDTGRSKPLAVVRRHVSQWLETRIQQALDQSERVCLAN